VRLILNDRPAAAPTSAPEGLFKPAGAQSSLLEPAEETEIENKSSYLDQFA
jgi:hypothetical protein